MCNELYTRWVDRILAINGGRFNDERLNHWGLGPSFETGRKLSTRERIQMGVIGKGSY